MYCHVNAIMAQAIITMEDHAHNYFVIFSLYSFGQNLLCYVLDVLEIPVHKENLDREDVFKKMLEWCDIWIILLTAHAGTKLLPA